MASTRLSAKSRKTDREKLTQFSPIERGTTAPPFNHRAPGIMPGRSLQKNLAVEDDAEYNLFGGGYQEKKFTPGREITEEFFLIFWGSVLESQHEISSQFLFRSKRSHRIVRFLLRINLAL